MEKQTIIDDNYAQKIADVCKVPYSAVIRLRDEGCLNNINVRNHLIKNDYWSLMRTNKFTRNQAISRVAEMYRVSVPIITQALKTPKSNFCYCQECGAKMFRTRWIANGYLCDACIAKQIKT